MLYAIGDPHLSLSGDKPMSVFGPRWAGHPEKIRENWEKTVKPGDTVVVNGDISWAMKLRCAAPDLDFINSLPGQKIFVLGNHDYWFTSKAKFNELYPDIFLLARGVFTRYKQYHLCGTKGWLCPGDAFFQEERDRPLYDREAGRLKMSLDAAMRDGAEDIIVITHFPLFADKARASRFLEIIEEYPVRKAVYGHLHGASHKSALVGERGGVEFMLVSSDYVDFTPVRIVE